MSLILASTSTTRKRILTDAGVVFEVVAPDLDEEIAKQRLRSVSNASLAMALATEKSLSLSTKYPDRIVLGADQTLQFDNTIISKCRDTTEAEQLLRRMRNSSHLLQSALSCSRNGELLWSFTGIATMHVRNFSDAFLQDYIMSHGEILTTSVGAYRLEENGSQLFDRIEGDYHTILGLPLLPLLAFLRQSGLMRS
jgi:septum formation protein